MRYRGAQSTKSERSREHTLLKGCILAFSHQWELVRYGANGMSLQFSFRLANAIDAIAVEDNQ